MLKRTLCLAVFAAATLAIAQTPDIVFERDVAMKTRDGVTLRADIYRPQADGKFPVLLAAHALQQAATTPASALGAPQRGFVVIVAGCARPLHLRRRVVPLQARDRRRLRHRRMGRRASLLQRQGRHVRRLLRRRHADARRHRPSAASRRHLSRRHRQQLSRKLDLPGRRVRAVVQRVVDLRPRAGHPQPRRSQNASNAVVGSNVLPLTQYPALQHATTAETARTSPATLAPYFLDWLAHPTYDDYWKQWSIEETLRRTSRCPLSPSLPGTTSFRAARCATTSASKHTAATTRRATASSCSSSSAATPAAAAKSATVDFGPDAAVRRKRRHPRLVRLPLPRQAERVRQRQARQNLRDGREQVARRRRLAAGTAPRRPATSSTPTARRNTPPRQRHALDHGTPRKEPPTHFVYDPANPVPTVGGPLCCDGDASAAGPARSEAKSKLAHDVLVYSTPPLEQDTEVTGPVTLDLFAKSSAVDTDFTAKLVDVWPNGFAQNLTEGILRAAIANRTSDADAHRPRQGLRIQDRSLVHEQRLSRKATRIRLEVSSSNFPRFDRNLNTGKSAAKDSAFVKATQTIYHDSAHPSALVLPIVPR